ncbi:SMI1/KNR4 family protein [Streptomyces sp. NPDC002403]
MPATEDHEPTPEPRPAAHPWRDLLQRWSDAWLDPVLHEQERHEPLPDEIRTARWLGGPGATPEELAELEDRLGIGLPPSYREFLHTSNGWLDTTTEIRRLLPAREVDRATDNRHPLPAPTRYHSAVGEPACGAPTAYGSMDTCPY